MRSIEAIFKGSSSVRFQIMHSPDYSRCGGERDCATFTTTIYEYIGLVDRERRHSRTLLSGTRTGGVGSRQRHSGMTNLARSSTIKNGLFARIRNGFLRILRTAYLRILRTAYLRILRTAYLRVLRTAYLC